jgi:hypothetical protein
MAECVISWAPGPTGEPETECGVHRHPAPCPLNGKPACPDPMHGYAHDPQSRDRVVAYWQLRTRRQRQLVIHKVTDKTIRRQHRYREDGVCWCGTETFGAEEPR